MMMMIPGAQDEQRATLFRRAVTRHLQYAAWAADGQGVDRHLFGLKRMLKEGEPLPAGAPRVRFAPSRVNVYADDWRVAGRAA